MPALNEDIQTYLMLLYFALLRFTGVAFLQIECQTSHQQKDHHLPYCGSRFIAVVWTRTRSLSRCTCI